MGRNLRITLITGGIILAVLMLVATLWTGFSGWQNSPGWGSWGGMMGPGMMGFGFGGLMMIPMVIFWGLVIWGIIWLVRGVGGCCVPSYSERTDSAMDILKKRYAQGEINKEEFDARKKDLV